MGFFDNLSKKATETYKNTTDKTNRMAREMKLKSYIGENKNKINGIYTEIGKKVYEKHKEGNVSDIEEFIKPELAQIVEIARKIENMNNEIRTLNNIKLCQSCAAEIDLSAKFCPQCGAQQKDESEESDTRSENEATHIKTVDVEITNIEDTNSESIDVDLADTKAASEEANIEAEQKEEDNSNSSDNN